MTTRTIDTNVLVRLLVDDQSEHATMAAELARRFQLIVLPTVILEAEWVLRSSFRIKRARVLELLRQVIDFEKFIVVEKLRVIRAIEGFEKGMDFADAMHVSFTVDGETFVTFDKDLARYAAKHINSVSVELAS